MRPRPDAAENSPGVPDPDRAGGASMRPRPDAAENLMERLTGRRSCRGFNEAAARCRGKRISPVLGFHDRGASMRPRPDAAENVPRGQARAVDQRASMRPRPDAAENCSRGRWSRTSTCRFNEAAARCRGKRRRPGCRSIRCSRGFNEAAARCRGKLAVAAAAKAKEESCFNEAAARCRGKRESGERAAKLIGRLQ